MGIGNGGLHPAMCYGDDGAIKCKSVSQVKEEARIRRLDKDTNFSEVRKHIGHDISMRESRTHVATKTGAPLSYPKDVFLYCNTCNKEIIRVGNPKDPSEYYGESIREAR